MFLVIFGCYGVLNTFWKGQGLHGLCLPSHCLQYKKDVCKTDKKGYELAD